MDEDEYKATYNEIAAVRCVFEKALTNNLAKCTLSQHFCLADREGYSCKSAEKASICSELLKNIRENSRFLFKLVRTGEPLPHNMEIRVQVGGIEGLNNTLHPEHAQKNVADVVAVVDEAVSTYGSLAKLPYREIVQTVAAMKVRKRSRKKQ